MHAYHPNESIAPTRFGSDSLTGWTHYRATYSDVLVELSVPASLCADNNSVHATSVSLGAPCTHSAARTQSLCSPSRHTRPGTRSFTTTASSALRSSLTKPVLSCNSPTVHKRVRNVKIHQANKNQHMAVMHGYLQPRRHCPQCGRWRAGSAATVGLATQAEHQQRSPQLLLADPPQPCDQLTHTPHVDARKARRRTELCTDGRDKSQTIVLRSKRCLCVLYTRAYPGLSEQNDVSR